MFNPSSVVQLLCDVKIDNNYVNTYSFSNVAEQETFFKGKTRNNRIYTDLQYQRIEKCFRVEETIDHLFDVSYMMYQNENYGSKWFYAFITDMKYVNPSITEIYFEIDVLQTWLFDTTFKDCYIEREHTSSDNVGEHLVDENLNCGEYIIREGTTLDELNDLSIVVATTTRAFDVEDVEGSMVTGAYTGCAYYAFDNAEDVNDLLNTYDADGKEKSIACIFMMPKNLIESDTIRVNQLEAKYLIQIIAKNYLDIDGYTPKNKKLFNYPYNFLSVSNNMGGNNIYKYEYGLMEDNLHFVCGCNVAPSPTVYLIPSSYRVFGDNPDEMLTLNGYPICTWVNDVYKNWVSQNAVSNTVAVAGSVLSLGVGVATGNPIAIGGGVLGVASSIGAFYEKSIEPNPLKGSASGGGNVAVGLMTFSFYQKTIRSEFAKIIDDYFDRYGYKVNALKIPLLKSRTTWNFIKMSECNIFGNIPNSHIKRIQEIHKNGVTYWHDSDVGNYNRSNTPVGGIG